MPTTKTKRKTTSKSKAKIKKVVKKLVTPRVNKTPKVTPEKPSEGVLEPKKATREITLPVVDGYQVTKVREEGHTLTHYSCEAQSEYGDKVVIHVQKELINNHGGE